LELCERLGVAGGLAVSGKLRAVDIEISRLRHNQMVMNEHVCLTPVTVVN